MTRDASDLKVLVVDDERPARQKLHRLLTADADVTAVYQAADGVSAIEIIRAESPDIVFLDIQMPGLDGFGVVDALPLAARPRIVFVTAHDTHAVRAFDVHAIDYLLKPYDAERFNRALSRAKETIGNNDSRAERDRLRRLLDDAESTRPQRAERILVESDERVVLIAVERIDRVEAHRNYVRIRVGAETYRVRATIAKFEMRLDPMKFVRLSRSEIVNVSSIAELRPWSHGDYTVLMRDGSRTRMSRRYRKELDRFGLA
jgi:two-component system, LytTR family, response regulator